MLCVGLSHVFPIKYVEVYACKIDKTWKKYVCICYAMNMLAKNYVFYYYKCAHFLFW